MSTGPINSLNRFRKRSGRLVLDETSAGCGGVVFRWRNPHTAVPVQLGAYAPVPLKFFIDGVEVTTTNLDLSPGLHQVALALEVIERSRGLILFAAVRQNDTYQHDEQLPPGLKEIDWEVLSAPDGSWLASLAEPPPSWTDLGFDDTGWQGLTHSRPIPSLDWQERGAYLARWCGHHDAVFLALTPNGKRGAAKVGSGRVWIRKRLEVPGPLTA